MSPSAKIRLATDKDRPAITNLMAACFGAAHHKRSVHNLRLCEAESNLSFVQICDDRIVGSIRYWPVLVGAKRQLLLGPLAVDPAFKGQGFGKALVSHSLSEAAQMDYDFVLISGEPDYYPRFGFEPVEEGRLLWPGFIEPERLQIKWLATPKKLPTQPQAILPILP